MARPLPLATLPLSANQPVARPAPSTTGIVTVRAASLLAPPPRATSPAAQYAVAEPTAVTAPGTRYPVTPLAPSFPFAPAVPFAPFKEASHCCSVPVKPLALATSYADLPAAPLAPLAPLAPSRPAAPAAPAAPASPFSDAKKSATLLSVLPASPRQSS